MRFLTTVVIASCAVQMCAQPQYEVVDLTAIYGQGFEAVSINDSGVIGGNLFGRACIAFNGTLTMLPQWKGGDWTLQDFGNYGDAMGWGTNTGSGVPSVYYDAANGTSVEMGISGAPANGQVFGINSVGQATGQLIQGSPGSAFVWEQGQPLQLLEPLGAGYDLNDSTTVVGVGGGMPFAAMWVGGKYQNLHPIWAADSEAVSVNEMDEAVGRAWAPGTGYRAMLWRDGVPIDLGDLGGGAQANHVNDHSQIVGLAFGHGLSEGFFWEKEAMYRLEDLVSGGTGFVVINSGTSINNSGEILASGFTGSINNSLLFRPIPEPETATLLGGFCGLLWVRRFAVTRR